MLDDILIDFANVPAAVARAQYEAAAEYCAHQGLAGLAPSMRHWLDTPALALIDADPKAFEIRVQFYAARR